MLLLGRNERGGQLGLFDGEDHAIADAHDRRARARARDFAAPTGARGFGERLKGGVTRVGTVFGQQHNSFRGAPRPPRARQGLDGFPIRGTFELYVAIASRSRLSARRRERQNHRWLRTRFILGLGSQALCAPPPDAHRIKGCSHEAVTWSHSSPKITDGVGHVLSQARVSRPFSCSELTHKNHCFDEN